MIQVGLLNSWISGPIIVMGNRDSAEAILIARICRALIAVSMLNFAHSFLIQHFRRFPSRQRVHSRLTVLLGEEIAAGGPRCC